MVIASVLSVILGVAGAALYGAIGTMAGAAAASWIGALLFWRQLRIALRESASRPAGYTGQPGQPPQFSQAGEPARPAGQHRE